MSTPLLSVRHLSVSYGPIRALTDVSLDLLPGSTCLLGGANGAGKSTLLKACSGLVPCTAGEIIFNGTTLGGLAAHRVAALGLIHVPEGRRIWPTLNVREHLDLAGHGVPPRRRRALQQQVVDLFPRLSERWHQDAARLSGGEQQMLAIGRGLMSDPRLLLIDELSLGLAPILVAELFAALDRVGAAGVSLLLVEQALHIALPHVEYGYVLEQGRLAVQGTSSELRHADAVARAYFSV